MNKIDGASTTTPTWGYKTDGDMDTRPLKRKKWKKVQIWDVVFSSL